MHFFLRKEKAFLNIAKYRLHVWCCSENVHSWWSDFWHLKIENENHYKDIERDNIFHFLQERKHSFEAFICILLISFHIGVRIIYKVRAKRVCSETLNINNKELHKRAALFLWTLWRCWMVVVKYRVIQ